MWSHAACQNSRCCQIGHSTPKYTTLLRVQLNTCRSINIQMQYYKPLGSINIMGHEQLIFSVVKFSFMYLKYFPLESSKLKALLHPLSTDQCHFLHLLRHLGGSHFGILKIRYLCRWQSSSAQSLVNTLPVTRMVARYVCWQENASS